tara:strand:+ start:1202 stop:1939 length:738 start_codon:yes stop_codon:yes gene_type:complete
MFDNIIEFSSTERIIENKELYPIPCKLNIPEWFKKLEHTVDDKTIKGCIPFLDTLTTGYLLKTPLELYLQHNVIYEGKKTTFLKTGQSSTFENSYLNINKKNENDMHPAKQLGKCPYVHKNKNLPFQKIMNPWIIKTPPGYSCLFVPPLNNTDDRFSIIPGIVDTDIYPGEINFPIIVNGDKYPVLETMISIGTPYVQVIPFKRESWKMKIKVNTVKKNERFIYKMREKMLHSYKSTWWNKKKWK